MPVQLPEIDPRTALQVVARTEELAERLTAGAWQPPPEGQPLDPGAALIRVFGRFAELVIRRLNRAPEKHLLAFLDLIGARLRPPQAARAPLTFSLAEGTPEDLVVPARTPVAVAEIASGGQEILFETEHELVASAAPLARVVLARLDQGKIFDFPTQQTDPAAAGRAETVPAALEHLLYFSHPIFALPGPKSLSLYAPPGQMNLGSPSLRWSYWDGSAWQALPASGSSVVPAGRLQGFGKLDFATAPALAATEVDGLEAPWLRARLAGPLPPAGAARSLTAVLMGASGPDQIAPALAFADAEPLDLSKAFYPFGREPALNSTFYLSSPLFAVPGLRVTLSMTIAGTITPSTAPALELRWQALAGGVWTTIDRQQIDDRTTSLSATGSDKTVRLTLPAGMSEGEVNGETGYWIRAFIAQGSYGTPGHYKDPPDQLELAVLDPKSRKVVGQDVPIYTYVQPTYAPPILSGLTLNYDLEPAAIELCTSRNGSSWQTWRRGAAGNPPAVALLDRPADLALPPPSPQELDKTPDSALYLGFGAAFPARPMTLYFGIGAADPSIPNPPPPPDAVSWQHWGRPAGSSTPAWLPLTVDDGTWALYQSGTVAFLGPPRHDACELFGETAYWIRAFWPKGQQPRIDRVLSNTVWAEQAGLIEDEVLGGSNGRKSQMLRTSRAPVLAGQVLEVRELEARPPASHRDLAAEAGHDALKTFLDEAGEPEEVWVRWQPVTDFHTSGPRSRHYVFDALRGTVRFGDGERGRIPPRGAGNVRMAHYRIGGGAAGNVPAGTISEPAASLPGVDSVWNAEPAQGGAESETLDELQERGPTLLRHRGRGVTVQDYADLVHQGFGDVARAWVIAPAYSAVSGVWLPGHTVAEAGRVGILIVPRTSEMPPAPSDGLLAQVWSYLAERSDPTVDIWVAGPGWVRTDLKATLVPRSIDSAAGLGETADTAFRRLLDPVDGGPAGHGWSAVKPVAPADIHLLFAGLPGVDQVRNPEITFDPDPASLAAEQRERCLLYPGSATLTIDSSVLGSRP